MHWSGDRATLTLAHLNKEDEGLYTLRVSTKSGYETYSAYVFVRGVLDRNATSCNCGWIMELRQLHFYFVIYLRFT